MYLPRLRGLERQCVFQNKFGGYEHIATPDSHCFYDMLNLSADSLPAMSTRKKRARYVETDDVIGGNDGKRAFADDAVTAAACVEDRICYTTGTTVYFRNHPVTNADLDPSVGTRCIVPFGRGCFISPDGKYIVPKDNPLSAPSLYHASFSVSARGATVSNCSATGSLISVNYYSPTAPTGASQGECWLNTGEETPHYYYYMSGEWRMGQRAYVMISGTNVGKYAVAGDILTVDGLAVYSPKVEVAMAGTDYLIVTGAWAIEIYGTKNVTVRKPMPRLDFCAEHLNRLWGCRYGTDENGKFVNEIYASKAGDPTCWNEFKGISTDAFAVSLGCAGEFTGVAELGTELLFFKENCIVRVTGSTPQDFNVTVIPCRGVKKGAHRSVVLLNEKVFYMGVNGVHVYDGALPYCISDDLGEEDFTDTVAGQVNGRYYIAMTDPHNGRYIYVFDTRSGRWFKEDDRFNTRFLVRLSNCLYSVCLPPEDQTPSVNVYSFYALNPDKTVAGSIFSGTAGYEDEYIYNAEKDFDWFAESGRLGTDTAGTSCLRNMVFRIEKPDEGTFAAGIRSGEQKEFTGLCLVNSARESAFAVTVNTPRCDSYSVKLWGKGTVKMFSRSLISEKTGEVKQYGE